MRTIQIKDIGDVITGHTPPTSKKEYYGDYALFIKPTDISVTSKYTYATEEGYSELAYKKYKSSMIPKGSTCVVCIGTLGEKMTMAHCDCFTNQSMNSIVPNDSFDQQYVYYLLKNSLYKVKNLNKGTASGREFVSKSTFLDMEIDVHEDINTQRRIGQILCAYDDLIENNQKQIKLLEEAAQRLYKEWFVDLRFPGHEKTEIVDGVPKGWSLRPVSSFGEVVTGKTPSTSKSEYYGGDIPFVKIPDMHGVVFPIETETTLSDQGAKSQKNKFIPKNSIMVSCIATVGLVNISVTNCQTNQQINSLVLKNMKDLYYVYASLKRIKELLDGVGSNGATMTNVNKNKFERIEILYPNRDLVEKYQSFCAPIYDEILTLSLEMLRLQEKRNRLLPKLVSGEIEV